MNWISVEERLPDFDVDKVNWGANSHAVLVVAWGKVYQADAHVYKDGKCVFTMSHVSGEVSGDVTHWMPLPDPPVEYPSSCIPVDNSLPRDHFPGGQNWNAEATPIKVGSEVKPRTPPKEEHVCKPSCHNPCLLDKHNPWKVARQGEVDNEPIE